MTLTESQARRLNGKSILLLPLRTNGEPKHKYPSAYTVRGYDATLPFHVRLERKGETLWYHMGYLRRVVQGTGKRAQKRLVVAA